VLVIGKTVVYRVMVLSIVVVEVDSGKVDISLPDNNEEAAISVVEVT